MQFLNWPRRNTTVSPEIWEKSLVTGAGWRALRDGAAVETALPDFTRYLSEEHHRFYGRPWCVGRAYFEFLRRSGLTTRHNVLDFGCGAGRLGIWLIGYLKSAHYVGVDHHWEAIDAFCRYELPLHGLLEKSPRLVLDSSLDVPRLGKKFDVILDCFVSHHLKSADRVKLYRGFAASLTQAGRIFVPHEPTLSNGELGDFGLKVVHSETDKSPFLAGRLPDMKAVDHWHIIAAG